MRKSHLAGEVMGACRKAEEGKKPMVITISEARSFMVAFVLGMTISSLFVSQQKCLSRFHQGTLLGQGSSKKFPKVRARENEYLSSIQGWFLA